MKSEEIRKRFLGYFEKKGHKILPGSSLVPSDPTVLLTLAGMLQFKPIFLGEEEPKYPRVTTVQKCLRMVDIENVGKTPRHHTFFEMLGNFSFGDYFKKDAIGFAWELLTQEFKLPAEKLFVAVFEKDDEAFEIWNKGMGLPENKIYRLGEENNFWAVGPTGPCGPCSEIYYDFGPEKGCGEPDCKPGCDCNRFLEVWNLVFIQFNRNEKGELIPLKKKGIDTGMGLERIASLLQGVESNFATDLFVPLIDKIRSGVPHQNISETSLKIVADHIRGIAHLIADGVLPENTGRGYVLRRLIRRSVLHGRLIGLKGSFLYQLSQEVVKLMGKAYPQLQQKASFIEKVVKTEEENFEATLDQGLSWFEKMLEESSQNKVISGEAAFKLHDTYGFPIELTREMAQDRGYSVDEKEFNQAMEQQKEQARLAGLKGEGKKKIASLDLTKVLPTKFVGYQKDLESSKILALFPEKKMAVLEKTPFYGESGGQIGDTGILILDKKEIRVVNTFLGAGEIILHELEEVDGLKAGMKVRAQIDSSRRKEIANHHTATHLLHKALREVLGEHVKQAGSYVGPDSLRFDFAHFSQVKSAELEKVEELVNQKIKEKIKVETLEKSYPEAIKMGAIALFGEKYGEKVRAIKVGNYSLELCGGTHVKNTHDILFFKITSEGALGAGLRRIEAVAGQTAKIYVVCKAKSLCSEVEELIRKYKILEAEKERHGGKRAAEAGIFEVAGAELENLSKAVDSQNSAAVRKFLEHLEGRADWLKERIAKVSSEINELEIKKAQSEAKILASQAEKVEGVQFLLQEVSGYSMEMLRALSDSLQATLKSCLLVLVSLSKQKIIFLVTLTSDLVSKGYSARDLGLRFAEIIGGRCGGSEKKAEGGGGDPHKVKEGFAKIAAILKSP